MHVSSSGDGPVVVLCHGFPDLWYSWRHQIPALVDAGYRVLVPDMRGYGGTSIPSRTEDYALEHACADMLELLDAERLESAVFVGHDWGAAVVWNLALRNPDRVRAVVGMNLPLMPHLPIDPLRIFEALPGRFDYQLYMQEAGVAERELEADVKRTFTLLMRGSRDEVQGLRPDGVRARGGMLAGIPNDVTPSAMLTAEDLSCYVSTYERTGFRGGLSWYRNHRANWQWEGEVKDRVVTQPALMVTVGKDPILHPSMADGMERRVPALARAHIEECGHFTPQDAPAEVNRILDDWLRSL